MHMNTRRPKALAYLNLVQKEKLFKKNKVRHALEITCIQTSMHKHALKLIISQAVPCG